jgi:ferredoxin
VSVRPEIDREVCAGYAECMKIAPEIFRLDDDDVSQVIEPLDQTVDPGTIELAASACPTQAIRLITSA